jgi:hypothetical protein
MVFVAPSLISLLHVVICNDLPSPSRKADPQPGPEPRNPSYPAEDLDNVISSSVQRHLFFTIDIPLHSNPNSGPHQISIHHKSPLPQCPVSHPSASPTISPLTPPSAALHQRSHPPSRHSPPLPHPHKPLPRPRSLQQNCLPRPQSRPCPASQPRQRRRIGPRTQFRGLRRRRPARGECGGHDIR